MLKIAVLISGGGTNLQALINAIEGKELAAEINLVISNKRDAYGLIRAKNHRISTEILDIKKYPLREERQKALLQLLLDHKIDLVVLAGYLDILSEGIIKEYENRIMNIHPSLIPSFSGKGFYGERVHKEAIRRGVKISGATVHFVNEETDGGPIILQEAVAVEFCDDEESLQKKVLALEHKLLPRAVKLFAEGRLKIVDDRVEIINEIES
ncbi:phosphoribosylglycinamide formyltransferase [Alkaliphilus serpentinus]|uniref:Phosphoribosylglycinamide formyltransferase n=1 Tax=Alkaliphilus serpentinus TaxID=1482731 RepID=A0A833M909_9FIRM|nr:phosphoribosylglycinamide formyltransferase [Alkaliphilus serpentinus]KAB3532112.1 phosphoribosylglycinamide formyltransferase [Alkaliphilus serpentinus]